MNHSEIARILAAIVVAAPLAPVLPLLLVAGTLGLPSEKRTSDIVRAAVWLSAMASVALAWTWFVGPRDALGGHAPLDLRYGALVDLGAPEHPVHGPHEGAYRFELGLLVDGLSVTMMLLTSTLTAVIARFSVRYLHREEGFFRYFVLLALFAAAMQLLVLAGSLDLLFVGWELVGLSSMLLIGFFRLRPGPQRGAITAMVTYRTTDIGLLIAAVLLHHAAGSSEFADAFGRGAWPQHSTHFSPTESTLVCLSLLLAAVGKSALFPFGTWLPRAMEGPTSSSALFYGGLSVHAGVYLLLRAAPLLSQSRVASIAVGTLGVLTAVTATLTSRTRSDVKSALAYATMTQVGWMLVWIGLHFWTVALAHLVAHACLRTLQLLRAPSALQDAEAIRAALSLERSAVAPATEKSLVFRWVYRVALEDFFVDRVMQRALIRPLVALSARFDAIELRIERWVAAEKPPSVTPSRTSPNEVH